MFEDGEKLVLFGDVPADWLTQGAALYPPPAQFKD
jgi:meiotically up-regulated gene 157 (Mug157) protein